MLNAGCGPLAIGLKPRSPHGRCASGRGPLGGPEAGSVAPLHQREVAMTSRAHTADDPLRVRHTPTSPGRGIPPRRHRSPGHKETPAACLRSPLPPCPPAPSLRCCSHCCWRLLLLLLRRRRRCRRRRRRCCCRFHRSSPFLFIPSVPRRRMYVRGRCHRVIRDAAAPCRPRGCMQCLPQPSGVCSCLLCAEQRCVCRRGDVVSSEVCEYVFLCVVCGTRECGYKFVVERSHDINRVS